MTTTLPAASARAEKAAALKGRLDEHLRDLAEQMGQGKSEALIRYLEFTARLHAYSFRNIMLILNQRPDATHVAGLRRWNRFGRHVRAGEKGIMIFAPMTMKKRVKEEAKTAAEKGDGEEDQRITLFKIVYVFDGPTQTEGDPLPDIIEAAGDVSACLPRLREAVIKTGIILEEAEVVCASPLVDGASYGGRIILKKGLADADFFRTLAHEYCHEILHSNKEARESKVIRETEADAAAFVVCRHFGVECDTADYLLLHDSNPKLLLGRLETIRGAAARIIGEIERKAEDEEGESD